MHAGQYVWSSHDVYCEERQTPAWLSPEDLLAGYGGGAGYLSLYDEVRQGREMAPIEFENVLFGRGVLKIVNDPDVRRANAFGTPTEALDEVAELTCVTRKQLTKSVPGRRGNAPKALALWCLVFAADLGTAEAGRTLGLSASASSQILSKWRAGKNSYRSEQLWRWKTELESRKS